MIFFIEKALASSPAPCALVNGCSGVNTLPRAIAYVGSMLLDTVSAICVLMVVYAGIQMTFNNGDEGAFKKGQDTILYAMVGFAITLLSQTIVNYASLKGVAIRSGAHANLVWNAIAVAISSMIDIFNVAIIFIVIFAGFQYVLSRGSSDKAQGAAKMVAWAIVGGVCINMARMVAEFVVSIGL
jgi:hypothetical protein